MSNGKDMMIHSIVGLIKKYLIKMSQYFSKPQSHEENIKVKIDLSNYVTKEDIKKLRM